MVKIATSSDTMNAQWYGYMMKSLSFLIRGYNLKKTTIQNFNLKLWCLLSYASKSLPRMQKLWSQALTYSLNLGEFDT